MEREIHLDPKEVEQSWEQAKATLERYRDRKIPTGSALQAALENNLKMFAAYADEYTMNNMKRIVRFICNDMPMSAQGSPENVRKWLEK